MSERITIRIDNDVEEALDRFISLEGAGLRTKQDAYRFIIRQWLMQQGYLEDAGNANGLIKGMRQ